MLKNHPQKGFYYHYKHDPNKGVNHYAYELLGVSITTEPESREEAFIVVYRPLYQDKEGFLEGVDFCDRPLDMFVGTVIKDGVAIPRFSRITQQEVIQQLENIKLEMYP